MAVTKFNELFEVAQKIDKVFKDIAKDSQIIHDNLKKLQGAAPMKDLKTASQEINTLQKTQIKTQKELNAVRKKTATINNKAVKEADKITQSLNVELQTKKELLKLNQRLTREKAKQIAEEKKFGRVQRGSIKDLQRQQKELTLLRNRVNTASTAYKKYTDRLSKVNVALQKTAKASKDGRPGIVSYNSAIGKGIAKIKDYAKGLLGMAAAFAVLRKLQQTFKEYVNLAREQILVETKLATVLKERTNATDDQVESIIKLTKEQQKLGVIGDEVQIAGAQQFSTFVKSTDSVKKLIPALNNLIAQQKGVNATQADAVNIANLAGRAFQGQLGSLTRVGISFDEAQGKILKYGTESEKAAALASIITQNVGNMNEELAKTDVGKMQQMNNEMGDIKETIGKQLIPIMISFKEITLNSFKSFKAPLGEFLDQITGVKNILEGLGGALKGVTKSSDETNTKFTKFKEVLKSLISPLKALFKWNTILIKGYQKILTFLGIIESKEAIRSGNIRKRVDELTKSFINLSKVQKEKVLKEFQELNKLYKSGEISILDYTTKLNALILKAGETEIPLDNFTDAIDDNKNALIESNKELDKTIEKLLKFEELTSKEDKGIVISQETSEEVSGLLGDALGDEISNAYNSQINKIKATTTGFQKYINQLFKGDGTLLERILGGGEGGQRRAQFVIETWQQTIAVIGNLINVQLDSIQNVLSAQDEQIAKTEDLLKTELDRINELEAAGSAFNTTKANLLQAELDREKAARAKTLQEEKALHRKQQNLQVAQAAMDVASGILNAWKTGSWIENIIETAAITALGAFQIGTIKNQKFAEGGIVGGNLHSSGGTMIEAEKDEFVVRRQYAPKSMRLLEMINAGVLNDSNYSKTYMTDMSQTNSYLKNIDVNTQQNKVYDSNGNLKQETKFNTTNFYGAN